MPKNVEPVAGAHASTKLLASGPWSFRTFGYIILIFSLIMFLVLAIWCVEHGMPNADEGFYALSAQLVWKGQLPYRDFAYTQTPLLPYLQGAAMELIGFGARQQRWLNVFWSLSMLVGLGWYLIWTTRRPLLVGCIFMLWCGSLPLVYYSTIGKSYALTQLILVIAAWGLWLRRPWVALVWISFFGVLAVGCRLTSLPAVCVIYFGAAMQARQQKVAWLVVIGMPLVFALCMLGPFYAADPVNAYFWTWQYHTSSLLEKRPVWRVGFDTLLISPGLFTLMFVGVWVCRRKLRAATPFLWCLLAGMVGILANIVVPSLYAEYTVIFMPLLIIGITEIGGLFTGRTVYIAIAILTAATFGASVLKYPDLYAPSYLSRVDTAAAFLEKHTDRGAEVLTPIPEVALRAGRSHVPGFEMGCFSLTGEMSDQKAVSLGIRTYGQLLHLIESGEPAAIVFSFNEVWNFNWSVPSLILFNQASKEGVIKAIGKRYYVGYYNDYYIVCLRRK